MVARRRAAVAMDAARDHVPVVVVKDALKVVVGFTGRVVGALMEGRRDRF